MQETESAKQVGVMDEETRTQAKLEINRIIWQYGRPDMTLEKAEMLAVDFWQRLVGPPEVLR